MEGVKIEWREPRRQAWADLPNGWRITVTQRVWDEYFSKDREVYDVELLWRGGVVNRDALVGDFEAAKARGVELFELAISTNPGGWL
jgi:hypothetical protein